MDWGWWLGAALVLGVVEMLTVNLVLVMFAGGAVVAMVLALLGVPLWGQIVGFAASSTLLLFALRPWLLRHLRTRVPLVETNASAHVGRMAVVVQPVRERTGRIKLAGEVWSARTDDHGTIEVGDEVRVLTIDGATAVVTRIRSDERPADGESAQTEESAL